MKNRNFNTSPTFNGGHEQVYSLNFNSIFDLRYASTSSVANFSSVSSSVAMHDSDINNILLGYLSGTVQVTASSHVLICTLYG